MAEFIAVKDRIDTEIEQAILDFQDIKQSMVDIGINVDNKKTCEYADLILSKKVELDKVPVLEAEVLDLTTQNNELTTQNTILTNENNLLSTENEQLSTEKEELSTEVNELTDQVNNLVEQSADNVEIIDDAILAVQEKGGTVENKSQLPTAIRAIEGNVENNFHKYFVDGERNIEAYLDKLASGNIIKMGYMLQNASLTGGNIYLLDLSSCLTQDAVKYIFNNTVANGGDVNIQLRAGVNNTTLNKMMYNDKINTYGWNVLFTDDSDCSGLKDLTDTFRKNYFNVINLSKLSNAQLTSVENLFRDCKIVSATLPLNTSNVDLFSYCFSNCTLSNVLDLSNWDFKQGCKVNYMFNETEIEGSNIVLKDNTVFSNCLMEYMFYNNDTMTETPVFDIVDTEEQAYGYAFRSMFHNSANLCKINSTQPWHLRSNTSNFAQGCIKLETVPEIHFYVSNKTNQNSISSMFSGDSALKEVTLYIHYVNQTEMYCNETFLNNTSLEHIYGNLDLSLIIKSHGATIVKGCSSLIDFETTGSLGGLNTDSSITFDFSASPVFNIGLMLERFASNDSGKTRIIKLNSSVYSALTDDIRALATSKNYTLASA